MTTAAACSGSLARMLPSQWNQQRIRRLFGQTVSSALRSPGAPSAVTLVGTRKPRFDHVAEELVHAVSDSVLPTARCSRCLNPAESMPQHTRTASLAPQRRNDSKIASA